KLAATRTTLIGDGASGTPRPIRLVNVNGTGVVQFGHSVFIWPHAGNAAFQGRAAETYQRLHLLSPVMQRALDALEASPHGIAVVPHADAAASLRDLAGQLPPGGNNTLLTWSPDLTDPIRADLGRWPQAEVLLARATLRAILRLVSAALGLLEQLAT